MATGGDTLEKFPTKNSDSKDDAADLTAIPKHAERRGTEDFAALQLQQELALMQMQFQKEIEKQKQAHKEKMEEILNIRKNVPAQPALESVEFLAKYRQAEHEMEARVKNLENIVRETEKISNKSLAKVEKLRRQVSVNPGSRAARALERELKKNPQRRLANKKWRERGREVGRRTDRHRPGKTSDGLTVLYYSSRPLESRIRRRSSFNFPEGSLEREEALMLVGKVRSKMRRKRCTPTRLFHLMDVSRRNIVSYNEFVHGLAHIDVHLPPKESKTVFAFLDRDGLRKLSLDVFIESMAKSRSPRKQRPSDSSDGNPAVSPEKKLSALPSSTSEYLVAEIDRITQARAQSPTSSPNLSNDFGAYVATPGEESVVATPGTPDVSASHNASTDSLSPTSSSPAHKKSPQKQQSVSEDYKYEAKPGDPEEKLSAQAKSPSRKPMRSSLRQPKVVARFKSASSPDNADWKGTPSRAKAADKSGRKIRRSLTKRETTTPKAKQILKSKSLRKCKTAPPPTMKKSLKKSVNVVRSKSRRKSDGRQFKTLKINFP